MTVDLIQTQLLGFFTCIATFFAVASLLALAFTARNLSRATRVRKGAFRLSVVLLLFDAFFGAIFLFGRLQQAFDLSGAAQTTMLLSLIAGLLSTLLTYTFKENNEASIRESTLLSLLAYSQSAYALTYMCCYVIQFGNSFTYVYVVSVITQGVINVTFLLILWHFIRLVSKIEGDIARVLTIILTILVLITGAVWITTPLTGIFFSVIENATRVVWSPMYPLSIVPMCAISVVLVVLLLTNRMTRADKYPLILLSLASMISQGLEIFIPEFDICPLLFDIAIIYCSFGVSLFHSKERQRHMAKVQAASDLQQSMLPHVFPKDNRLDVAARMWSAKEVAGDFYDVYQSDENHVYFMIADVSGKDIPAGIFMARAFSLIREYETQNVEPHEIFTNVNKSLAEGNSQRLFVTAWMAKVDLSTGCVAYSNAGHNPPLFVDGSSGIASFVRDKANLALGMRAKTTYAPHSAALNAGDRIIIYTDGVTESINEREEQFGNERLLACAQSGVGKSCSQIVEDVHDAVTGFAGTAEQFDDIALLCFEYVGSSCGAPLDVEVGQ